MSLRLPEHPNLDVLRRQAKAVLRVGRLLNPAWRLSDAQWALARGYGRSSWRDLKEAAGGESQSEESVATPRRAVRAESGAQCEPPAAASPSRLVGLWVSRDPVGAQAALEIAASDRAFWLTQVATDAEGRPVAGCLLLRVDGREHVLGVNADLRIQAAWKDEHTLRTTVTRNGVTVSEGTYVLSVDGDTLTVAGSGGQLVLDRRTAAPHRRSTARRALRVVVAGAVLICCGCATLASPNRPPSHSEGRDQDVRAIEALNRHDIAAALASDIDAVASQWTDDFVVLPPAGPIVRGRSANLAMLTAARPQLERLQPVAYSVAVEEIVVTGDYAFAWGSFRAAVRPRAGGADVVSSGKLLRVYQRQRDGRWLMHRTMSTMDAPVRSALKEHDAETHAAR